MSLNPASLGRCVISSSLSRDKVQAGKGEILKDKQKENGP